jgi:ribosomal protein L40E
MDFDPFTLFVIFVAVMLVAFLARTWMTSRRDLNHTLRECKACGATQPGFARFCRRCGRAL